MHRIYLLIILVLSVAASLGARALAHEQDAAESNIEQPKELVFRTAEPSPVANFVVQLFTEVYAELGITLRFEDMPRNRSLTEANKGRIAGELGRVPMLAEEYENLMRVEFPLYDSEVMLVADRRNCGICSFESIESFGYIAGTRSVEALLEQLPLNKPNLQVASFAQLELMYDNDRVDALVLNDLEAELLDANNNPYTVFVPYARFTGYHYLHKKYAHLIPLVEAQLSKMLTSGRILELIEANDARLLTSQGFNTEPSLGEIRIASGVRPNYAQGDVNQAYLQLIRDIFAPVATELDVELNSFGRAYRGLDDNRFDALIGAQAKQLPNNAILSRNHIDFDSPLYVYTNDQDSMRKVLEGTLLQPVCQVVGYQDEQLLPNTLNYYVADSLLDCFAMLDMGRMGAVISYETSVPEWSEAPYVAHKLRDALPLHVAFPKTPHGYRLRDWFDREFRKLVESGAIRDYFSDDTLQRSFLYLNLPPQATAAATP
ncbi:hypothetical protein [Pseudidiomarina sp. YC-516-91]|uniref:hypothetical protein n=1 Tax=Pseudidiomarina salilacus TaxID=3384452 RepID=UPI003984C840